MVKSSRIPVIIFIFTLTFLIAGCGSGIPSSRQAEEIDTVKTGSSTAEKKVTLKFAQWSVPLTNVVEQSIQKYNLANKDNLTVELVKIPRSSYNDTINMLLSSGEGPDIFEARYEWLFSYIYKNWVYDLTNKIDDVFLESYPAWVINLAHDPKFRNYFYSMPSGQVTYRLIYNKDLFKKAGLNPEKPPETLDEMMEYAKKITQAGKGDRTYGFAFAANDLWSGFAYPLEAVNLYSGKYFYNFKEGRYDLSVYQPWLNTVLKMKEEGAIFPGETTMKEELALIQFAEGNIGMMYAENWKPLLLKELFPAKCDWAAAMPPTINKGSDSKGYVGIGTTGWQVINKKTKYPEKAVLFWKHLYSPEYNEDLLRSGCFLPSTNSITNDPSYMYNIPNLKEFMPGPGDMVYPATPLDIDECRRANAYMSIFNGTLQLEKALADESNQLNMLLDMNNIKGNINISDYTNPDFYPSK